jgi:hypothetical protein
MLNFWMTTVARVLLGLVFLLGAIDGFAFILTGNHLIHPPTSEPGLAFESALKASGFIWPAMKAVELVAAFCLLANRAPALGLALLLPLIVVISLFHVVLNPQGIPLALLVTACALVLLNAYASRFAGLLAPGLKRTPKVSST